MRATGTHVKPLQALVPGCMSVFGDCLRSASSHIGVVVSSIGGDGVTTCAGHSLPVSSRTKEFEPDSGNQFSVDVLAPRVKDKEFLSLA